jgi:hypothetical protein
VNEADRDGGFARACRLGPDQLEAVVVRGGENESRGKRRGGEDCGADRRARENENA